MENELKMRKNENKKNKEKVKKSSSSETTTGNSLRFALGNKGHFSLFYEYKQYQIIVHIFNDNEMNK